MLFRSLTGIAITTPENGATFTVGATLNLVVTATYADSSTAAVTGYTATPANGATLSTAGPVEITVSYTEGGETKTATRTITVA